MKFSTEFKSYRWKKPLLFALAVFSLSPNPYTLTPASAAINQSINYQGFLVSKTTNLAVDSPQDMKFAIYDVLNGGSALFTESRCNVPVSRGRYDVEIGSATSGGIPADIFQNLGLWLEIQVDFDGDCAGTYEAMLPRVRLQAAPFAFNSLYASTASAGPAFSPGGTPPFKVDIIGAQDESTNGAVTVSSNLFVLGGISVGSISPGMQLSVSGVVESKGDWPVCGFDPNNYTCGFRFPDGSVQITASGITKWYTADGPKDLYNYEYGNIGISTNNPQAKLHISTGPGETGDVFRIDAGSTKVFNVTGQGNVYGNYFHGNGANLTSVNDSTKVSKRGDNMTGTLYISSPQYSSVSGARLIVNDAIGIVGRRLEFTTNVEISSTTSSSTPAGRWGGLYVSTHVWLGGGSKIIGDGSQLTGVISEDTSKVLKTGDTMSGRLIISGSSVTIITTNTAAAPYSLAVTTDAAMTAWHLYVSTGGSVGVGTNNMTHKLRVEGDIMAVSSITAEGGFYTPGPLSADSINLFNSITATTATFTGGWGFPGDKYSIETASSILVRTGGIMVSAGAVTAPYFIGNGSQLTNVLGTDTGKVSKTGDTMTGPLVLNGDLTVTDSSVTVINTSPSDTYVFIASTATAPDSYALLVDNQGRVGVHVALPASYLDVYKEMQIINPAGSANIRINTLGGSGYIRWSDASLAPGGLQGVLGFPAGTRDFLYRAAASDPASNGAEVFRITSDDIGNWKFGIGISAPDESLHINANMLVGLNLAAPALYVSTTSSAVGISTTNVSHKLVVAGGILAVSSITAGGGFYGDVYGDMYGKLYGGIDISSLTLPGDKGIGSHFAMLKVGEWTDDDYAVVIGTNNSITGNYYDMVVTPAGRVGIGVNTPDTDVMLHTIKGIRIGRSGDYDDGYVGAFLDLQPDSGATYIKWDERYASTRKGVLGFITSTLPGGYDLQYRTGAINMTGGDEALRIYQAGGAVFRSSLTITGTLNVAGTSDILNVGVSKLVVKMDGKVGIGIAAPTVTLDVNGALTVTGSSVTVINTSNADSYALLVSTIADSNYYSLVVTTNGKVGIGTASPAERLEVNGKVKATGFAASREWISNTCAVGVAPCTASCTAGKLVLGGGCSNTLGLFVMETYPSSDTAWICDYNDTTGSITAYAICSTVE